MIYYKDQELSIRQKKPFAKIISLYLRVMAVCYVTPSFHMKLLHSNCLKIYDTSWNKWRNPEMLEIGVRSLLYILKLFLVASEN